MIADLGIHHARGETAEVLLSLELYTPLSQSDLWTIKKKFKTVLNSINRYSNTWFPAEFTLHYNTHIMQVKNQ